MQEPTNMQEAIVMLCEKKTIKQYLFDTKWLWYEKAGHMRSGQM